MDVIGIDIFKLSAAYTFFYSLAKIHYNRQSYGAVTMDSNMQIRHFWALILSILFLLMLKVNPSNAQLVPTSIRREVGTVALALNATERRARGVHLECPTGSGYVFDPRYQDNRFLGCVPLGQYACMTEKVSQIAGSCPVDEVCCISRDRFMGCALSTEQCCVNKICPEGYMCCGDSKRTARCCPLEAGESVPSAPFNRYCDATQPNQCNATIGTKCNFTVDPLVCAKEDSPAACRTSTLVQCRTQDECLFGNDTLLPWLMNATSGVPESYGSEVPHRPEFCCPQGLDLCIDRGLNYVGCANATKGETCCNSQICSDGHKCCSYRRRKPIIPGIDSDFDIIVESKCCPNATQCCSLRRPDLDSPIVGVLLENATNPRSDTVYCGVPVVMNATNTLDCQKTTNRSPLVDFFVRMFFGETFQT